MLCTVLRKSTYNSILFHEKISFGTWLFSAENYERLRKNIGGGGSFLKSIFEAWDVDRSGSLSLDEVKSGLLQLKLKDDVSESAIATKIFQEINENGDESLSMDEFQHHAVVAC